MSKIHLDQFNNAFFFSLVFLLVNWQISKFISWLFPCFNKNNSLIPIIHYSLGIIDQFNHLIKDPIRSYLCKGLLVILHISLKKDQSKILDLRVLQHNSALNCPDQFNTVNLFQIQIEQVKMSSLVDQFGASKGLLTSFILKLIELIPLNIFRPTSIPLIFNRSPKALTLSINLSPVSSIIPFRKIRKFLNTRIINTSKINM